MTATDWLVDGVIAAGAFGFGLLQLSLSDNYFIPDDFTRLMLGMKSAVHPFVSILATFLTCLPLAVRRKLPWVAFVLSLGAWCAFEWPRTVVSLSLIGPIVALFTVAMERPRAQGFTAGAIAVVAVLVDPISVNAPRIVTLSLIQNIAIVVAVTFAGYGLYSREQYIRSVRERAIEAEQLRQAQTERELSRAWAERNEALKRVEEQRVQIARDLHDITAHSLSAISIQAAAAERLIGKDDQGAREAVGTIRETARSSLDEIRAMVGVLRSDSQAEEAQTAPMLGTEDMDAVASYLRSAGIRCTVDEGRYDRSRVPAVVDLALGRILREAATNIVKHADATRASIVLSTEDGHARLLIEDDGRGMGIDAGIGSLEEYASSSVGGGGASQGNGIAGMFERVGILGGTITLETSDEGGLRLLVTVPLSVKKG